MAAERHGHPLGDASTHPIANSGAAQIAYEQPAAPGNGRVRALRRIVTARIPLYLLGAGILYLFYPGSFWLPFLLMPAALDLAFVNLDKWLKGPGYIAAFFWFFILLCSGIKLSHAIVVAFIIGAACEIAGRFFN